MIINGKYQGRKVLFLQRLFGYQISEEDRILTLNKVLQKDKEGIYIRFY